MLVGVPGGGVAEYCGPVGVADTLGVTDGGVGFRSWFGVGNGGVYVGLGGFAVDFAVGFGGRVVGVALTGGWVCVPLPDGLVDTETLGETVEEALVAGGSDKMGTPVPGADGGVDDASCDDAVGVVGLVWPTSAAVVPVPGEPGQKAKMSGTPTAAVAITAMMMRTLRLVMRFLIR